jgi:hypothetical protein
MRIILLLLPILFFIACRATPTEPAVPTCEFRFMDRGTACIGWELTQDGGCLATCYQVYSDEAQCPIEALPKGSPIRLRGSERELGDGNRFSYDYRSSLVGTVLPAEHPTCSSLEGAE